MYQSYLTRMSSIIQALNNMIGDDDGDRKPRVRDEDKPRHMIRERFINVIELYITDNVITCM